jgi:phage terminase large subunit
VGTIEDFQNYRYKRDRVTNVILPIPVDASNHSVDATRYGLCDWMKSVPSIYDIMPR